MVAQLLGLRLSALNVGLRRRPPVVAGALIALLVATIATMAAVQIVAGAVVEPPVFAELLVVGGFACTLAFVLLPAVFPDGDGLDPRRLTRFRPSTDAAAGGLVAASVSTVPVVLFAVLGYASVHRAGDEAGLVWFSILTVTLTLATAIVGYRLVDAWVRGLRGYHQRRRTRVAALALIVLLVAAAPMLWWLTQAPDADTALVDQVASIVGWLPLGAGWSAPFSVAAGDTGGVWLRLGVVALTLAAASVGWRMYVRHLLVDDREQAPLHDGLGWFAALPATPVGVVAARSLTYWGRDPRYWVAFGVVPVAPLVLLVPLWVAGVPWTWLVLLPIPLFALLLGWMPHNDVSYDHSAFWLHVSSAVRGWQDRFGRIVPQLLIGVPVIVAGSFVCGAFAADSWVSIALLGLGLCILLGGLAASSVFSALEPYAAVPPGAGAFQQPQAFGGRGVIAQIGTFVVAIALAVPAGIWTVQAATGDVSGAVLALVYGVVAGAAALLVGVLAGGRIYDERGPELLAAVQRG